MVGIAGSTFPTGKANKIISPPAIPVIPINVGDWVFFILELMAISAGWSDYPMTFKSIPNYTPRRGLERV
jgi:hypothetical protein